MALFVQLRTQRLVWVVAERLQRLGWLLHQV
jgi:hypothetical protein